MPDSAVSGETLTGPTKQSSVGHWGKMSEPGNAGAAWNREIEARIVAHDRGDLQAFSPENVFAEARRDTR